LRSFLVASGTVTNPKNTFCREKLRVGDFLKRKQHKKIGILQSTGFEIERKSHKGHKTAKKGDKYSTAPKRNMGRRDNGKLVLWVNL